MQAAAFLTWNVAANPKSAYKQVLFGLKTHNNCIKEMTKNYNCVTAHLLREKTN